MRRGLLYGCLDSLSYLLELVGSSGELSPQLNLESMRKEGWEMRALASPPPSLRLTGHSREMKFNYKCNKAYESPPFCPGWPWGPELHFTPQGANQTPFKGSLTLQGTAPLLPGRCQQGRGKLPTHPHATGCMGGSLPMEAEHTDLA